MKENKNDSGLPSVSKGTIEQIITQMFLCRIACLKIRVLFTKRITVGKSVKKKYEQISQFDKITYHPHEKLTANTFFVLVFLFPFI